MTGAICLMAGLLAASMGPTITLRWTHSIENILWEEDYQLEQGRLRLTAARIRGTGAGMEPPAGAQLRNGIWHYVPDLQPLSRLELRHSPHVPPYEICSAGRCQSVDDWLPGLGADAVLELAPCASLLHR